MIRWVPFSDIGHRQLTEIAKSLLAQPEHCRLDKADIIDRLEAGTWRLFEWDDGLFIVHREDEQLIIDAMTASIWDRLALAHDLKRLAADWLCDTVKTTVFDKRLADAIVKIGGRIESYDVILPVNGTGHEQ